MRARAARSLPTCDAKAPAGRRLGQVLITGDFFVAPPRLIFDLESHLRASTSTRVGATVEEFFAAHPAGALSVTAADFRRSLEAALAAPDAAPVA